MRLWQLQLVTFICAALVVGGAIWFFGKAKRVAAAGEARRACEIASPTPNPSPAWCSRHGLQ
jgi:hypothetical protein